MVLTLLTNSLSQEPMAPKILSFWLPRPNEASCRARPLISNRHRRHRPPTSRLTLLAPELPELSHRRPLHALLPPNLLPLGPLARFEDNTRKSFDARRYKWFLRHDALITPPCHDNFLRHKAMLSKSWTRITYIYPTKNSATQWSRILLYLPDEELRYTVVPARSLHFHRHP
jgi:hypothetical protein